MPAFSRAAEITYYEELGLKTDATPEQIRDAFRSLVRLLHPDQQTDEQLKDIAEKQMRKLNRIYGVLSDPDQRRRYDESLDEDYTPIIVRSRPLPAAGHVAGKFAWVAAIVVSAGFLIWLASDNTPAIQIRSHDPIRSGDSNGRTQNDAPEPQVVAQLRTDLQAVTAERDAAIRELTRLRAPAGAQAASIPPPENAPHMATATSLNELPSLRPSNTPAPIAPVAAISPIPVLAPVRTEPSAARPVSHRFAGFWFYSKPAQGQRNKNQALYIPEFMEATIREENGGLAGSYRSRYQILDRAISPDVNFTFACPSASPAATCAWTGSGGAKGEVALHLNSENALKLDWNASELGSIQGLVSGTAVLTRRIDPN